MKSDHLHEVREILASLDMKKVDLFQVAQLMNQMMAIEKAQFRIMRIKKQMKEDGAIDANKFFNVND